MTPTPTPTPAQALATPPGTLITANVVPPLVTVPVAALLIAAILIHLLVLVPRLEHPSRQRIRRANGYVMLAVVPLVTIGFSGVSYTTQTALWITVWICALTLLALAVALAVLDAANTVRIHRKDRNRIRRGLNELRAHAYHAREATDDADPN